MKINRKLSLSLIAVTAAMPCLGASERDSRDLYDSIYHYDSAPYNHRGYSSYEYPYYQQNSYYYYFPNNQSHLQPNYTPPD